MRSWKKRSSKGTPALQCEANKFREQSSAHLSSVVDGCVELKTHHWRQESANRGECTVCRKKSGVVAVVVLMPLALPCSAVVGGWRW